MAPRQMQRRVVRRGATIRTQHAKKQRLPDKKLLYIGAAAAAVVLVVVLLLIFTGRKTFVAERGTLSFSTSGSGIVIRSEKLYSAEGYGRAEYVAQEGQVVSAGTPIADVYNNDFSDSDYAALKELQEKILDYQQNNAQSGIIDEDMVALDEQINSKTEQIRKVISGEETGNLEQLQREISQLMDERTDILRKAAKEDAQLAEFYTQEQTLITRIQNYKRTLVAENDGVVSFYFDGTETLLTPENMSLLTVKNINSILGGTFRYETGSEAKANPLYRLVDRNRWYVVMIADQEIDQFAANTEFTVTFSFGQDYTYHATVCNHLSEAGKELYFFEFDEDVDKLLRARQVSFQVSARYVGIRVPKSAIKEKDGEQGVYYVSQGQRVFEPVEVLITEEKDAIIRGKSPGSGLEVGCEIYH